MVTNHRDNLLPPLHGLLFQLARDLLYALIHGQVSTYHGLCFSSRGALAGTRNSLMGPLLEIDPTIMNGRSTTELHLAPDYKKTGDHLDHK